MNGATEKLAAAQEAARPKGIAAELEVMTLLQKYSLVEVGANVRVAYWSGTSINLLRPEAFRVLCEGRTCLVKSEDGDKKISLAKVLLARMRRYDGLVYEPGEGAVVGTKLNMWRGFAVESEEGKWTLMYKHIWDVLASGDRESAYYILKWLAWLAQNPGERAGVALVIRGAKGTGKGTLGTALCRIFGGHSVHISNRKHLTAGFNKHLMHCSFLLADEAYWPGDRAAEGELKRLLTEPTLFIEPKGLDGFSVKNCLHALILGNAEWVVPASADERRFAVFDIADRRPRGEDYFEALYRELNNGGLEAMLYDLLIEDLAGWHPRHDIPQTEALLSQKAASLHDVDALVADLANNGCFPYPVSGHPNVCSSLGEQDGMGLWAYAKKIVPELRHKIPRMMMQSLRKDWDCKPWHVGNDRGVEFPPLTELRQLYVAKYGPQAWDSDQDDWGS